MTGDDEHPTYPNPTIAEALCHIDFQPVPEPDFQVGRPTPLLELTSSEYPNVEAVGGAGVGVALSFDRFGAAPRIVPAPPALKLSSDDRKRYLGVGDSHFAYGQLAPYPGWNRFREGLLEGWSKFSSLTKPANISRVGLRYVNLIPRTLEHSQISDWLQ